LFNTYFFDFQDIAPDDLLKVIRCNCKITSKNPCSTRICSCRRNGISCLSACGDCRGVDCNNSSWNENDVDENDGDENDVGDNVEDNGEEDGEGQLRNIFDDLFNF